MKRTVWMMAAVGIVLLGFAACGSAAPESPDESVLFAANGPALTVVEKQPDQYTTDPEDKTVPPEQSPDLLTMNSQEEEGFALFYPLLSETQFRCLMDEDGVDFIPNRLVSCEEGGLAYYSTAAGDLVYCTADFSTVKAVLCQQRVGLIIDARWLDADHLLFLQGNENEQAVYLFRPAEDMVELLYQSPEGRQILGIELDENGHPTTIPHDHGEYFDVAPLDKAENVRRQICLTLEEMNIQPESSHHEQGPGQNEVDFRYSDPLSAADNAVTFLTVVKTIAARNGLYADFSPRPLERRPGSGFHINMSVQGLQSRR